MSFIFYLKWVQHNLHGLFPEVVLAIPMDVVVLLLVYFGVVDSYVGHAFTFCSS